MIPFGMFGFGGKRLPVEPSPTVNRDGKRGKAKRRAAGKRARQARRANR